jgi:malto-oligosyltrehalose trehalohydrolase
VHNALYWLEEFHLDGLRLDAVHAIVDTSGEHVLDELARAAAEGPGRDRLIHLVLENDANEARYLARTNSDKHPLYRAQWNDDMHHAVHVMLTGEKSGYYGDYQPPLPHLARCLTEGFAFQGQFSSYRGRARGEPSADLPPTSFVGFLQNHDQIGNRALGERMTALAKPEAVRAATAVLLLAPQLPLLFMGQEWAAPEPFLFFSDLGPDVGPLVSEGRRREFARFPEFAHPDARALIPDPQAEATRTRSVLDWTRVRQPPHAEWLAFHRQLLEVRAQEIAPLLVGEPTPDTDSTPIGETALEARWVFPDQRVLRLLANLGSRTVTHPGPMPHWGRQIYPPGPASADWSDLPPWSVRWHLSEASR